MYTLLYIYVYVRIWYNKYYIYIYIIYTHVSTSIFLQSTLWSIKHSGSSFSTSCMGPKHTCQSWQPEKKSKSDPLWSSCCWVVEVSRGINYKSLIFHQTTWVHWYPMEVNIPTSIGRRLCFLRIITQTNNQTPSQSKHGIRHGSEGRRSHETAPKNCLTWLLKSYSMLEISSSTFQAAKTRDPPASNTMRRNP